MEAYTVNEITDAIKKGKIASADPDEMQTLNRPSRLLVNYNGKV